MAVQLIANGEAGRHGHHAQRVAVEEFSVQRGSYWNNPSMEEKSALGERQKINRAIQIAVLVSSKMLALHQVVQI